ncbi:hypothetical protein [Streptomyces sp. NPDC047028]|uniref:hypothetical protein n=1 Tax=Streptomyces sp. NPDC047028 TaxID=3155793 RepID=UPI0033F7B03F
MAFPVTPLGLKGELVLGDTTVDITADLYTRDPITHTRGRQYRANAADPAACTATIRNRDGKYTPRNPEGPHYGLLGRNTPFHISLPGAEPFLATSGTTVSNSGASTPDTAVLDITGDIDVRIEATLENWTASGSVELCGKGNQGGDQRSWELMMRDGRLRFEWDPLGDGTTLGSVFSEAQAWWPGSRRAVRATLDADNGAGGWTARLYSGPSISGPWTLMTEFTNPSTTTSIFNSDAPLMAGNGWADLGFPGPNGRIHRFALRDGIDGTVVANPDFTAQTPGATSFVDDAGLTWTIEAASSISDRVTRFNGEVPEWPPKWAQSEADAWTPIEAAGILRRMGQGQNPLQSTLRRRVPSGGPLAYWPMEDGANATQAASPIDGVNPLRVSGLSFAADDTLFGSDALPTLGQTASISGKVPGATAGGWHTEMVYKLDKLPSSEQTMFTVDLAPGTGGVTQARARVSTAGIRVQALDSDGTVVAFVLFTDPDALAAFTGVWNRLQIFSAISGSSTYVNVAWRDVITDVWWYARTIYTGTPGAVTGVTGSWGSDFEGMGVGHLAAFDVGGTTAPAASVTIYDSADDGFNGERAGDRMVRLCAEQGVALTVVGDPSDTEQVGPQRPAALMDLLRDCANADGGVFGERLEQRELIYRTRVDLYNQAPKLTLDYAAGQLAPPFEPIEDDQVRNDWEVTRQGGSSGYATLTEGALSVQDPPAGIGLYDDSVTLNLYDDGQTDQAAGWLLHLTSWDEARYPAVTVRLHKHPDLIRDVLGLNVGDKIRIENLPSRFAAGGAVELLVDGWSEALLPRKWEITFNCSPAGPWTVGQVAVVEDFEDSATVVTATDGGDLPWGRTQTHFNTGSWSLQSGAITNNQTSDYIVAVPSGVTELTFWYRTSSEEAGTGFEGDRFLVLVDGTQVLRAQGETGWTSTTVDVTGASQVTFRYAKDNSSSAGEDGAWIDDLTFAGAPMHVDTDGSELAADATSTATSLSVATTDGPVWVDSTTYPAEFPFDITAGGERMRVTGISGTSSPQTFTVVRSLNGVVKAQTDGTDVRLADPAIAAL